MTKRTKAAPTTPPEHCFAAELKGENPPRFSDLEKLYKLAVALYSIRPWRLLGDDDLVVFRDSRTGETCHCCVMGALGEVFAVHAYFGTDSFRLYKRIQAGERIEPAEFIAQQHSVYVEFVQKSELERQDRELLTWLGQPSRRGLAAPIFRAMRPGFHPWFVTAEEAQTLSECIRATIAVAEMVASGKGRDFWNREDFYPMVSGIEDASHEPKIEIVESTVALAPAVVPVPLDFPEAKTARGKDYSVKGALEIDHFFSGVSIGHRSQRKSSGCLVLTADPVTGMILGADALDSQVARGDALAKAFFKVVSSTRVLPQEIRVRSKELKESLDPLMESFGVAVRVAAKLPAVDAAHSHMLQHFGGAI